MESQLLPASRQGKMPVVQLQRDENWLQSDNGKSSAFEQRVYTEALDISRNQNCWHLIVRKSSGRNRQNFKDFSRAINPVGKENWPSVRMDIGEYPVGIGWRIVQRWPTSRHPGGQPCVRSSAPHIILYHMSESIVLQHCWTSSDSATAISWQFCEIVISPGPRADALLRYQGLSPCRCSDINPPKAEKSSPYVTNRN
jgi:hypothetical protein